MNERRLKVGLVAFGVDEKDISEAQLSFEWVKHLSAHADVTCFTAGSRHRPRTGLEKLDHVVEKRVPLKIDWSRWDLFDRTVHPGIFEFHRNLAKLVKAEGAARSIDLFHAMAPFAPRFGSPIRNFGKPFVIGPLMGGVDIAKGFEEISKKEPWYFQLRKLDRLRFTLDPSLTATYRKAARILTMGPYLDALLPARYREKTVNISSIGVNIADFQTNAPKPEALPEGNPLKLLYVGRLVPFKGLQYVLRALPQLDPSLDIHLTVVGDGPSREDFHQEARALGVNDKITWVGGVPHDEVPKYFAGRDIFCFPSMNEAGGIVVLEAMATGLPVICLDRGGPGAIVDSTCGVKIEAHSPEQVSRDLAEAVTRIGTHPETLEGYKRGALAKVERYDWKALAPKMVEIYRTVLAEAR